MPTGLTSGKMFHVSSVGGVTGPYKNLYTTFSYDDAHCIDGSYKPTSETIIIDPDEYPDRPMRRHAEGMTFDTKRNAIWLATGVGDANTDATSINGAHSGFADLYEMTKSTQWAWSQICGFGGANVGTGVPSIGPGPGSLCGEETLTPETTSPAVAGIPCLDTGPKMGGAFGGVSVDGNNSSCGYKFPYAGFDPTNDAVVIFGGQFNSGVTCETVLYYPATNTWLNPYDPAKCGAGNVPPANWNQAGSRLVPIGDGRLLLFGGLNGNVPLSETWIFKTCTANNKSACGWEKVVSSVNPAADPTPVIDWDSARGVVVYIDKQAHAHTWFFNPITLQWSDENKLSSEYAGGPSLTRAMNNGKTQPYFSIGAYDALTNQMVVFNTCDATSTPACSHTGTQTWILDLP
jgi:hypothetical protein